MGLDKTCMLYANVCIFFLGNQHYVVVPTLFPKNNCNNPGNNPGKAFTDLLKSQLMVIKTIIKRELDYL
jgi:hypothetical protein